MNVEWTHKKVKITDVRKVRKFYVLSISDEEINIPLFVDQNIFEGRVNSYYLRDYSSNPVKGNQISREEVLNVNWNMVIYKGYFVKINNDNTLEKIEKDKDKFYISFLEIDGPLGKHISN